MPRPAPPVPPDTTVLAEAPTPSAAGRLRTFSGRALGSPLRLTVGGAGPAEARSAWAAVTAEMAEVDAALSRFRDDSELTALNRLAGTGAQVLVGGRLRTALAVMERARRVTAGRFDPRVLADLERLGERGAALDVPAADDGLRAGPIVRLRRDGSVEIDEPLDTGGIGKGLALRWAARLASERLGPGAGLLLEAGGDVVAAGVPPAGGWLVGVEDPSGASSPLAVVRLERGAVATSSVRVRRWRDPGGRDVHHLIDPSTGQPGGDGIVAVTVAGPDPAWSEVLSKSLFLAGPERIGAEARAAGLAAWWVDSDGTLAMTPAARLRSAWIAE